MFSPLTHPQVIHAGYIVNGATVFVTGVPRYAVVDLDPEVAFATLEAPVGLELYVE